MAAAQSAAAVAAAAASVVRLPKKYYRVRAHRNPFSESFVPHPATPAAVRIDRLYTHFTPGQQIAFADVGCGYGGLSLALAREFPDKLTLAMEIRDPVVEYVSKKIHNLRIEHPGQYGNVAVTEANAMKYLPNFFRKGQLEKLFFLFPDPHFKRSNHKRRIISPALLAEYAYCLAVGARLYIATDVPDLYQWMDTHVATHPLFHRLPDAEMAADPCVNLVLTSTEESAKVDREGRGKQAAVFVRVAGTDE